LNEKNYCQLVPTPIGSCCMRVLAYGGERDHRVCRRRSWACGSCQPR